MDKYRLAHFPGGTVEICVMGQNWRRYASASQSRTGLVSWHYPVCLAFLPLGCRHRSGKDRLSRPSSNVRQKWATGPYHRHFDANHRLILASCHDLVYIPGFSGRNPYHPAGRFLPKGRLAETACLLRQLYHIFPENPGRYTMGATNCQDGYFS